MLLGGRADRYTVHACRCTPQSTVPIAVIHVAEKLCRPRVLVGVAVGLTLAVTRAENPLAT